MTSPVLFGNETAVTTCRDDWWCRPVVSTCGDVFT